MRKSNPNSIIVVVDAYYVNKYPKNILQIELGSKEGEYIVEVIGKGDDDE